MKKTVKKSAIKEKEVTKVLINGKDTMPVLATDEFKRHVGGTLHRVFGTTGRTKTAAASKRNNLVLPQSGHLYLAPPKAAEPQWIILSMFSISTGRG